MINLSPPPPTPFDSLLTKLNDTNINYNVRNLETDLALPRPKTNFLKRSGKYSGAILWNNPHFPGLKANLPLCPLLDPSDSLSCMYVMGGSSAQGPRKIKINKQINQLIN